MTIKINKTINARNFELVIPAPLKRQKRYIAALLSNDKSLETAPSKPLNLPCKQTTLLSFLEINRHSQLRGYNRTFIERRFRRAVEKTNRLNKTEAMNLRLIVEPLITHSYRQMSKCETHYRCLITYNEIDSAIFDMTIADYERLEFINSLKESA